jgi:G:T-mismatch repair DNA endonuclease (very short patch repair protein)
LKSITIKEVRSKPASRAKTVAQLRERWSDPAEHKRWSKLAKEKSAEWHPALKAKRRHCDYCGKLYRHYNNGRSRFCSRKCEKAACTVTVHCRICKKAIQKERSVVKTRSTKSFFCSPKCYAKGVSWWMKRAHRRDPKLRHRMSYSQRRFHKAHPGFWQQLHKQHPELKGKISRGLKSYYSNHPEARVNVRKFLRSFLGKQNPSGIELMVRRFLRKQFPGQFRHTGQNYRSLVLQFVPDFVSKNKQILIFVDGCFYHNCPEHGNALSKKFVRHSVQERDSKLTKAGYKVVAVWEHELKSPDWQAKLKSRLDALLGSSIPTPA